MMWSIFACAYWPLELDFSLEVMGRFQTPLGKGVVISLDELLRKSLFWLQGTRGQKESLLQFSR